MVNISEISAALVISSDLIEVLSRHLSVNYNTSISQISELDQNVFRVDRANGSSWVARVFPHTHSSSILSEHVEILRYLEQQRFPSERLADAEPLSISSTGHHILVTSFVEGRRPRKGEHLFPRLGHLLGRIHTLSAPEASAMSRKGGAWHHICESGGPQEEIDAAISLLLNIKPRVPESQFPLFEKLRGKLNGLEDLSDLPQGFTHPDVVPANAIISLVDSSIILIDWMGAGTGPRAASLGFLLWAAGHRTMAAVEAVIAGYSKLISLEQCELDKLESAILFRPLVLISWEFCMEKKSLEEVVKELEPMQELTDTIAKASRQAFEKHRGLRQAE